MKKLLTLSIGITLIGNLFAQVPFKVEKQLKLVNGTEVEVKSDLTNISFKMSSNTDYMTITSENRDFGVKVKSKKMLIVDYKKSGEGIGGLRVYTCNSKDLGNILIEEELTTMTGKVMYDRDRDGTYEEIYVLESISN